MPIFIPISFVLCVIYLVKAPNVEGPRIEFLYAALFVVGGILLSSSLFRFLYSSQYCSCCVPPIL